MLTIRKLRKGFGGQTLFEDASLTINYGERVALVGPNGAGKSTLFSIILDEEEPDEGTVDRDAWTMIGYLPQESDPVGDETVMEIATGRAGQLQELEKTLKELEEAGDVESGKYLEANAKFDALNNPQVEAKAKGILRGLGFQESDFEREAKEMSGGWVMRGHLARLLVMEPDLLMLDEPTNHLDLESLLWLQSYLKAYTGALLMISHDRQFMDEIVLHVHEISDQKLIKYKGNYSDYLKLRQDAFERQYTAYKNQQKEIKSMQDFINKFRSVASKASQAQSRQKQLDKLERVPQPKRPKKPFAFQFPQPPRGGQNALSLHNVHMAYGDLVIYNGVDLMIERGDRTVLVGPNGAGKSTLLKILAGVLDFQSGERKLGYNAKIGYFSQHRTDSLDPNKTVFEEALSVASEMREDEVRGVLGSFLFRKDEIHKKTSVLSGGEKSRLNLVKFLVDPPNILLMDEPTTHLDILTVESLIIALQRYEGTLLFISHDVHFIRKLATKVVQVTSGELRSYPGGYDYFLEKSKSLDREREALTAS